MMKNLSGDYETIDYIGNRGILLHNNTTYEEYPTHWHNAVEIIMPLTNDYHVECRKKEYVLNERDILIIPAGELHHLYANEGRRLIIICDNAALSANPALSTNQYHSISLSQPGSTVLASRFKETPFYRRLFHQNRYRLRPCLQL